MPSCGQAFIPPSTVRFAPMTYEDSGPATALLVRLDTVRLLHVMNALFAVARLPLIPPSSTLRVNYVRPYFMSTGNIVLASSHLVSVAYERTMRRITLPSALIGSTDISRLFSHGIEVHKSIQLQTRQARSDGKNQTAHDEQNRPRNQISLGDELQRGRHSEQ
jgi:hypothetical protein